MSMKAIAANIEKKQLLDMWKILSKLCGEGEETIDREETLRIIEEKKNELLEEINDLEKKEAALLGGEYDLALFRENILCEDSEIILRKPEDDDLDPFYRVKEEYAYMKSAFAKPEYKDMLWQEYLSEESLYYTIAKREGNMFIGYCGVKDLKRKVWEIAIEINSDYCHKGYGYRALRMYLERVAELSGRRVFSSRVDAENIASQGLMEKLGFKPYGLSEFYLHKEEDKLMAEEEYKDELDDRYRMLAEKFQVEPRKLLSHVLEYRIRV